MKKIVILLVFLVCLVVWINQLFDTKVTDLTQEEIKLLQTNLGKSVDSQLKHFDRARKIIYNLSELYILNNNKVIENHRATEQSISQLRQIASSQPKIKEDQFTDDIHDLLVKGKVDLRTGIAVYIGGLQDMEQ